jgi:hypothetical protein
MVWTDCKLTAQQHDKLVAIRKRRKTTEADRVNRRPTSRARPAGMAPAAQLPPAAEPPVGVCTASKLTAQRHEQLVATRKRPKGNRGGSRQSTTDLTRQACGSGTGDTATNSGNHRGCSRSKHRRRHRHGGCRRHCRPPYHRTTSAHIDHCHRLHRHHWHHRRVARTAIPRHSKGTHCTATHAASAPALLPALPSHIAGQYCSLMTVCGTRTALP